MSDTEYPSWREALFSDDKIANIRCAIKYVLWHAAYILMAVIGIILMGIAKVVDALRGLAPSASDSSASAEPSRAGNAVRSFLGDARVKKAGRIIAACAMVGYVIGAVGFVLYFFISMLIANPVTTLATIAAVVVGVAAVLVVWTFGVPILKDALARLFGTVSRGASVAGKKAVETPGIRRIYGECPVHMDLEPKWFDKIFER